MANKRILDVEINDSSFKKFYELFEDYAKKVEEQPEAWQKLNEAMLVAGKGLDKSAASTGDLLAIAAAQTTAIVEALGKADKAQDRLGKTTSRTRSEFDKLGKSVVSTVSGIAGAGKFLLKLGGIAGSLVGLAGGVSMFDIANNVTSSQRNARGMGISAGQMKSWQNNMSPFVGMNVLQGAASAQLDSSQYGYLAALGISGAQAQNESATDLATQISNAARRAYQQNPNVNSAQAQAFFSLGGTMSDWRNLGTANGGYLSASERAARANGGREGWSDATAQNWQKLNQALGNAESTVSAALVNGLVPLIKPLEQFADWLSTEISTKMPDIEAALQGLVTTLENYDWKSLFTALGNAIQGFVTLFGPAKPGGKLPDGTPVTPGNSQNEGGWGGIKDRLPQAWGGQGNPQTPGSPSSKKVPATSFSHVMKAFEDAGYSTNFAAAMAGNFSSESGFDPGASSYDKKTGWHKGIGQWSADRRNAILAGTNGKIDVWKPDADMQLAGSIWEMQNTQKSVADQIAAAANQGPQYASNVVNDKYEVSGASMLGRAGRALQADAFAATGPQAGGDLSPRVLAVLKNLKAQQRVSLNVTNSTSARVAVSANAAAYG